MKGVWKGAHPVHPNLERFQAIDKGKGMEVVRECLSVDFLRGRFDSLEDIRGFPKIDRMGEMIFMSPAREADIHFRQVEFQLGGDQKVNSEIHTSHTKKQVMIHQTCFFPWGITHRLRGQWGPFPFLGKGPKEGLSKTLYICRDWRTSWPPS
jgi:hypothetical protein